MYFGAGLGGGWPKGYEAQVENTSSDPQRTGSLYNFVKIGEQLIEGDTWWTQHIIAIGNRVIIKVNDKVVVDFVDEKHTWKEGHLALQQHDPGSVVHYKNIQVRPLPDDTESAMKMAAGDPGVGRQALMPDGSGPERFSQSRGSKKFKGTKNSAGCEKYLELLSGLKPESEH